MSNVYEENVKTAGLEITISAPGKAILYGEHSAVYGKLAVCASLGLRTRIKFSETRQTNEFVLQSDTINFSYNLNLEKIKHIISEPLPLLVDQKDYNWESPDLLNHDELLKKVESFLETFDAKISASEHIVTIKALTYLCVGILGSTGVELRPAIINIDTDLKIGAGLGSSASFVVCAAAAFIQYVKCKKSENNFSHVSFKRSHWESDLNRFNAKDLDLICKWSFCAEKIIHGLPSGLDNSTCTYGNIVEYRKITPSYINPINMSHTLQLLLINTNVPRETKTLVSLVNSNVKKFPSVVNNIFNAMEAISVDALKNFRELSKMTGTADTAEIYNNLSLLCSMNHGLLNALGVGHTKLDEIIEILARVGLRGKLTGAGGGGFAICLIPPNFDSNLLEKTVRELVSRGFGVDKTDLGGDGVKLERCF